MKVNVCCESMEHALDARFISIGYYEYPDKTDNSVNIFKCYPWPEGAAWDSMKIEFCPFCGKKIEVSE